MTAIKVWGRITSINVQKVVWALDELELAFDRVDAGRQFGVVDSEPYRRLNPLGLVPTIDDNGFVLYESDAIVRYLAASYGKAPFYPADIRHRAIADLWTDWQAKNFSPVFRIAFFQIARTPAAERDPALLAKSLAESEPMMVMLDRHLSERPYVAGADFSYGDIAPGLAVHRWLHLPFERPSLPHVIAYYQRLKARPATRKAFHLPVE
ncbi:MAG: glutathione S-transferase [Hyphomicrobiales bacterium]|nr:glutathione S-transferase [Hyphomicrobiales bacterium]OQW83438.1 MAG: hypothetical protein BVN31_06020 [Proteobacteria bacterium ST_bin15]